MILSIRRSWSIALAVLALVAITSVRAAHARPDGSYPRTFNLDWKNDPDALRDSRYDMVSLSSRATRAEFDSIRALNPSSIRLVVPAWYAYYHAGPSGYAQTSGPWAADDPYYGWDRRYWNLINDNGWWAWAVDSTGVRYHASTYWNMWLANFSTKCPPNAQGKRLCDVYADFMLDDLVASKGADGVFFDHLWDGPSWLNWYMGGCRTLPDCTEQTPGTKYHTAFDLDGNYTPDSVDSMDTWWKQGVEIVFARIRQRMGPNFVIMGNGQHHFSAANGAMSERFPRLHGNLDPGYNPYGFRWQESMFSPVEGYLTAWTTIYSQPIRTVLDTEYSSPSVYEYPIDGLHQQLYRFNLGSTLLGDGYFTMNNGGYGCYYWQPEYNLRLGWPTGAAFQVTLQGTTVWKRVFTNGEVWVNPTATPIYITSTNPSVGAWDAYMKQANGAADASGPSMPLSFSRPTPNPSNASSNAALTFSLAPDEPGRVDVLDLRGRLVRHVWTGVGTGESQMALWDGRTDQGWIAPSGVYVARLEGAAGRTSSQKVVRVP